VHFGRNKIVLTYKQSLHKSCISVRRNLLLVFVEQVLTALMWYIKFRAVFFLDNSVDKQSITDSLMQNRQHGHGKKMGSEDREGRRGKWRMQID